MLLGLASSRVFKRKRPAAILASDTLALRARLDPNSLMPKPRAIKKEVIMMQIKVYSTVTCPYCKMLKDYLVENKVSFDNVFVDQDEQGRQDMMAESGGFLGVPFTVVTKDDGTKEKILGFDKNKINSVLGLG